MRPVALLSWWKLRNSLRTMITDPRKLFPAILFTLMMVCSLGSVLFSAGQTPAPAADKALPPGLVHAIFALVLIVNAFLVLDAGFGEGLLAFQMPDVDYLFPSPISRRVVLAYRMPSLLFTTMFTTGMSLYFMRLSSNGLPAMPGAPATTGTVPLAVFLSVGIWMNVALTCSTRIPDRRRIRKISGFSVLALAVAIGLTAWLKGIPSAISFVHSPILQVLFFPSTLAEQAVWGAYAHHTVAPWIGALFLTYALSFIPVFSTNVNWYEQSVVSSENFAAIRRAAKGGMAAAMAAQAERQKFRSNKTYTVKPFGQGATALFWAHFCAAGKRPWVNIAAPMIGGLLLGLFCAIAGMFDTDMAGIMGFSFLLYISMLFMGSARVASEAAIRRRELLAPLPISGPQSVLANLGVPILSQSLFAVTGGLVYAIGQGPYWPMVSFAIAIVYPIRLAGRMALQYGQVLGFPDLSDKVQQFLAQGVYFFLAGPVVIAEVICCIPAVLMKSPWGVLLTLLVFQVVFLKVILVIVGKVADRAVATGEPVSLWRTVRGKYTPTTR